ncbi:MAG: gliding motility-associated C-terminal domain-containing protein [Bacteroidetes bacterium]|nr:gliding motility-associated C-terminal domain-containing protein [Bacteroidota bacterium]
MCSNDPLPILDAGVPNGSYVWTLNGNPVGGNTQTLQTTGAGNYSVAVTSLSGCTGTDNLTVNVLQVPVVTLTNSTVCPGAAFPVLDAGNSGATYQWRTGEASQTITPSTAGTYTVTVTVSNAGINCSSSGSATVGNSNPVIVSLGNDLTSCIGDPTLTIDAGNTGSSFVWSLDGTVISGQTSQTIQVNQAGLYSVLVTDANGCTGTDDATLVVNPLPVVELGIDVAICPGDDLPTLDATTSNAATYSWTYNGTVVGSGPTIDASTYGTYEVTIVDLNGCIGTDKLTIDEAPCEIIIPNVFTPGNGDGLNDIFFIKNLETNPNSALLVFNRWGREVYSSGNYQNNWNGDDLPDGTYFYTLVLQTGKDYKGTVKIIRKK